MIVVPAVTPVTTPVLDVAGTTFTSVLLLLHSPPPIVTLIVIIEPAHSGGGGPEITGNGFTVTVVVISQVVGKV